MDPELKQYLEAMEARIVEQIHETEMRVVETMIEQTRDMQSELLKAFLPFQASTSTRQSTVEARAGAVESRMATIETRLAEIEKKLLLNPPAA